MRVGMILDNQYPPDPRVENEADRLIQAGHEVVLFCLDYDNIKPKQEVLNGVKVCRVRLHPFLEKFSILSYSIPVFPIILLFPLWRFLNQEDLDIIHIHDMQVALLTIVLNRYKRLPLILDLHENRPEIMRHYSHVKSFPGKYLINLTIWKKIEHYCMLKVDANIVVTREARDYYKHRGIDAAKITVVPNTVRTSFFRDAKISNTIISRFKDKFVLLYLGNTGLRRGLMTAIEALPAIVQKIPNLQLVIVGKSNDDMILKEKAISLEVKDHVVFEGWKDVSLFPSYISAASIGISPLLRNQHHDTTFANKIFQYMAFGKPLIVSDCTAQARIVQTYNCGLVFPAGDKTRFAAATYQLFADSRLQANMGANAKKAILEDLRWEIVSDNLNQLYHKFKSDVI